MMVRAGALRQYVELQRANETFNSLGESVRDWSALDHHWMAVRPITGKERFAAQQVSPEISHTVRCRYIGDITEQDRLVLDNGRVLYIAAVLNVDELGADQILLCKEHRNAP